ncbi:type IV pilus assembly protein PilM [Synechococcus elongatus]|uniref:type IV pilus biogenesis protein PilM n=1 Tax=Synechococcus elongatus TaxID=32046 RepID=UPI0030D0B995
MVGIFSKFLGGDKSRLGVEITPERINLAHIGRKGNRLLLQDFVSVDLPDGLFQDGRVIDSFSLSDLLRTAISDNRIKTKKVSTAVPGREVITRLLPMPAELDDAELHETLLNQEAALFLPFPREEADIDYLKLDYFLDIDEVEKLHVLLVATRRQVTDTYLDLFAQAGLTPDIVEVGSFALIRTIRESLRQYGLQEAVILLNIEYDLTEIVIIVGGVPRFSRTIAMGTQQWQRAAAQAGLENIGRGLDFLQGQSLSLLEPPADLLSQGLVRSAADLCDEVRRSADFYLSQESDIEVAKLYVAGPGSALPTLPEFLGQRLGLPVELVDPVEGLGLEVPNTLYLPNRADVGVVLGLATRGV